MRCCGGRKFPDPRNLESLTAPLARTLFFSLAGSSTNREIDRMQCAKMIYPVKKLAVAILGVFFTEPGPQAENR